MNMNDEKCEKNKEYVDQFSKDLFFNHLYSQYLKFIQTSNDEIEKIESIEKILDDYANVCEKALVFYIMKFDALEEIKKAIIKKYSQKVILDFKKDRVLNQLREEFDGQSD
jgi:hypothetical protein